MLYMIANFNFDLTRRSLEQAEAHYLTVHVPLAKRLRGLRHYVIGTNAETKRIKSEFHRTSILGFDSLEALRAAYRSDAGHALRKDEDDLIAEGRVTLLEGQVIV